jgi:penicillin-binding protein 1A
VAAAPTPGPDGKEPFDAAKVLHFGDRDQLISPQTAYLITDLMKGVVNEGTGGRAKALGRPVAGKTGTTNGYIDAWFVGFTPFIATGVWVGFDNPSTLGKMETGASAALPIWVDYMNVATSDYPPADFQVPPGIVFANIDSETGKLATSKTRGTVREAFREGTEPGEASSEPTSTEDKDFYKQDLSE